MIFGSDVLERVTPRLCEFIDHVHGSLSNIARTLLNFYSAFSMVVQQNQTLLVYPHVQPLLTWTQCHLLRALVVFNITYYQRTFQTVLVCHLLQLREKFSARLNNWQCARLSRWTVDTDTGQKCCLSQDVKPLWQPIVVGHGHCINVAQAWTCIFLKLW